MKLISMKTPGRIIILLFSSVISFAQIERKSSPSKQTDSLPGNTSITNQKDILNSLGLSVSQQAKLKEIRQTVRMKREDIDGNSQLTDDEKKKQLRELQKQQAKWIEDILTDEQKEKFRSGRQELLKKNKKTEAG